MATAVGPNQTSQAFKVNYRDGTSTTLTYSMGDRFTLQSYAGATDALPMSYRNTNSGRPGQPYLPSLQLLVRIEPGEDRAQRGAPQQCQRVGAGKDRDALMPRA